MKLLKELPLSIYQSAKLTLMPLTYFIRQKKETLPVIVSLTSIPSRLNTLHLVIKSMYNQDKLPEKIVLWLNEDLKNDLPKNLTNLESNIFEIRYSKLKCSHRKLIHSLKSFPDYCIVTCDDDIIYRKNWLSKLYNEHLLQPDCIIANRTLHINYDQEKNILPYEKWRAEYTTVKNPKALLPIGAWGILYPKNSLNAKVTYEKEFMALAPTADDLWFKAMALLNRTISIQAKDTPKEPIPIIGSQKVALKKVNLKNGKNTEQWSALDKKYKLSTLLHER